jgi:hypothetical protein
MAAIMRAALSGTPMRPIGLLISQHVTHQAKPGPPGAPNSQLTPKPSHDTTATSPPNRKPTP